MRRTGGKTKGALLNTAPGVETAEVWDLWKLEMWKREAVWEKADMEEQIEMLGVERDILRKEIAWVERELRTC
jgi:hypothetical protein